MLFITHDLASARYVADRTTVMFAGELVESGASIGPHGPAGPPLHPAAAVRRAGPGAGRQLRPRRTGAAARRRARRRSPARSTGTRTRPAAAPNPSGTTSGRPADRHWVRCHLYRPAADVASRALAVDTVGAAASHAARRPAPHRSPPDPPARPPGLLVNPIPTVPTADVAPPAPAATPHLRPSAHFTARDTWLNDPNGLLHHAGVYHLFFQNNPRGQRLGPDVLGARHLHRPGHVVGARRGHRAHTRGERVLGQRRGRRAQHRRLRRTRPDRARRRLHQRVHQRVAAVRESRRSPWRTASTTAVTWTRYAGNPVLDTGSSDFRDPKVFWHGGDDGRWIMVAVEALDRQVVIYSSPNLLDWTLESRFGPAHAVGGMWECPDLFPLDVRGTGETRWVLVVSLNPGAHRRRIRDPVLRRRLRRLDLRPRPAVGLHSTWPTTTGWTTGATTTRPSRSTTPRTAVG